MKKIWLILFVFIVVSCAVYDGKYTNSDNTLRVYEKNNLHLYAPNARNTLAVKLDSLSTLKLETNLPLLDGATALYPVYSAFAQAVYPKKKYYSPYEGEVVCNNTVQAYENLIAKTVDIIFVASPSKAQLDMAEKAGVGFRYIPIGMEAFVFFVNALNPIDNLTIEQLQGIYSGEITNWKELGGNDEEIRPFQRNENSGSQTAFIKFMNGKKIIEPPKEDVVEFMIGIVSKTADYANYGNSIGFSFRFYVNKMVLNKEVKILKINGVYPNITTIRNGTYPIASSFFAIALADNDKPNVSKFLEWIVSAQGQYLVKKTGYCPIK